MLRIVGLAGSPKQQKSCAVPLRDRADERRKVYRRPLLVLPPRTDVYADNERTASQSVKPFLDFTAYALVGDHPHGRCRAVDAERLEQAENPLDLVRFRVAIVRERDVQAGVSPAGLGI